MEEIKSITEAFSMQPTCTYVTTEDVRKHYKTDNDIKSIKLEEVMIGNNSSTCDFVMMYVCYGWDEKIKSKHIAKAMNVQYF